MFKGYILLGPEIKFIYRFINRSADIHRFHVYDDNEKFIREILLISENEEEVKTLLLTETEFEKSKVKDIFKFSPLNNNIFEIIEISD